MIHTPGPWKAVPYGGWENETHGKYSGYAGRIVADDIDIYAGPCSFWALHGRNPDEAEANARLIAAAPELLAACKLAVEKAGTSRHCERYMLKAMQLCEAAIAKATTPPPDAR